MRLRGATRRRRPGKDREPGNGAGEQVKRSARQCRAMWQLDQARACRQINSGIAPNVIPDRINVHATIGYVIARRGEYPAHCGVMLHRQSRPSAGQRDGKRCYVA